MIKTILITGSTDGIGKLAAVMLAKDGHEVFLHGRNKDKLETVIAEVISLSGNNAIKGYVADFSNLDQVRLMAQTINTELPKIDVLINNAGVFKSTEANNPEGLEMRFVVNYFAPYLLTQELMPLMKNGTDPRIINLSSAAQAPISYDALSGAAPLSQQGAYAQSKLALTMWSFHLATTQPGITVIPVNPGSLLDTNMVREGYGYHWSSADKGGLILYELAVLESYNGITGRYYDNDNGGFGEAHQDAYDEGAIDKLIVATERIVSIS